MFAGGVSGSVKLDVFSVVRLLKCRGEWNVSFRRLTFSRHQLFHFTTTLTFSFVEIYFHNPSYYDPVQPEVHFRCYICIVCNMIQRYLWQRCAILTARDFGGCVSADHLLVFGQAALAFRHDWRSLQCGCADDESSHVEVEWVRRVGTEVYLKVHV